MSGGAAPAGLTCPGCGQRAFAAFSPRQAVCGNVECRVLTWDPALTLEELAADMKVIELREWLGGLGGGW